MTRAASAAWMRPGLPGVRWSSSAHITIRAPRYRARSAVARLRGAGTAGLARPSRARSPTP
jgi:hypothetical protein